MFRGIKKKREIPDYLKDRQRLSKEEFGKKYYGDDKKLQKIAIEFIEHLENTYGLDLSGLYPKDRLCDILGKTIEFNEDLDENDTLASKIRKSIKVYIDYKPFAKYLKDSSWDKETISYRSFNNIIREIEKYRNK